MWIDPSQVKPLTAATAQPLLQLRQVSLCYPQMSLPAVEGINLTLAQGKILALVGPSGCGKTTLLRLIAGFERPQQGSIEMAGRPLASGRHWLPPEQRQIGLVFQDFALFSHMTVAENIVFGMRADPVGRRRPGQTTRTPTQVSAPTTQQRLQQLLRMIGLDGLESRYPHELSGGQQQRVALARALAPQPQLLLLDEPLSNLDARVRFRLREEIRDILEATGTAAIFVTHDQQEAFAIADQVAVMLQGQLAQIGTPEELYRHPCSQVVAEFLNQANFLPAYRQGGIWRTAIAPIEESAITLYAAVENAARGLLMIREEDLILTPHPSGIATIKSRQFLGQGYRYCLHSPHQHPLYACTSIEVALPVGTAVNLQLRASTYPCFPVGED